MKTIEGALEKMLRLRGVTFQWKEPEKHGDIEGAHMSMIAQEVEEVFPEWVKTGSDSYKVLNTSGFTALTVEAMREVQAEIGELRAENEALKTKSDSLEARVKALEALVKAGE